MPWKESHPPYCVVLAMALLLLAGCTPKPKYHGRPQSSETVSRKVQRAPAKEPIQAHVAFTAPVHGFRTRRLTSRYGVRRDPRYNTKEFHHGIDIKAEAGEGVLAAAPGTVIFAGRQSGFGKVVIIDHGKRFCTVSAHLTSILVSEGAHVARGDLIGRVGRSGNATGTHLHFELRIEGKSVDPLDYMETDANIKK